jgi:hypothetical protein
MSQQQSSQGSLAQAKQPHRHRNRFEFLRHVGPNLALASGTLFLAGFVFIGFYAASTNGPHLRYLGVGWLTACAAFVTGCLAGLVVGIPRFVSSGALRHDLEARRLPGNANKPPISQPGQDQGTAAKDQANQAQVNQDQAGGDQAGGDQAGGDQAGGDQAGGDQAGGDQAITFTPSTNLAEISDWLTKLLLGAGLVELTRLGRPLGVLVDTVARGLEDIPPAATPSGPSVVAAAAILTAYLVLGFLGGYVITTLWYGRHLKQLGYQ